MPWPDGVRRSQFNGRLECSTHNRHADKHDHDAQPLPPVEVTRLDELRARLRWRNRHYYGHDNDDPNNEEADDDSTEQRDTG